MQPCSPCEPAAPGPYALLSTRERQTVVYGVARRRSASVTLAHAPALEFDQGLLGRLLGYGTLVAGDFEVPYVPDARRIRKLVR